MPPRPQEHAFSLALITILALLCLSLLGGTSEPATVYVAPSGNDSHSCSQATSQSTPRRSINAGIGCLAGGDTLLIGDGTYNEQLGDLPSETPGTTRPPSGLSWSQPTTIKAANPRKATLNKPQAMTDHVIFLGHPGTQYVSIEGLVLDGRGHATCVWVGPSSHIRLTNNLIRNCGSNGILGATADDGSGGQDMQLDDNEITNIATEKGGQQPGAHAIYFTGNNSRLRGNYIHAPCPFYGIQASAESGGVHSNVIENNRIVGCANAGILSQGPTTTIRNNLLENNCIGIYLSSAPTLVAHNTIYGWHGAFDCSDSYGIFDKSGGSTLVNNLILQQQIPMYSQQTPPAMATNLCDGPGCQLQAPASAVVVDGPGGNLRLVPGGPAVNTGTTMAQVPTDRLGVTRPQGGAYDIGAYEYTTAGPGPTPPPTGDTQAPTAVILAPTEGALISGAVAISVHTTDNVGVVGVNFFLDGMPVGTEGCCVTVDVIAESTNTTNGPHVLTATARDQAGNVGTSAPVNVLVFNGTTPVPPSGAHPHLSCTGDLLASGKIAMLCQPVPQPARR